MHVHLVVDDVGDVVVEVVVEAGVVRVDSWERCMCVCLHARE